MELSGKRVLVAGLARSGAACAKLLCACGAHVVVNDNKDAGALKEYIDQLSGLEIEYRLGQGAMELVEGTDLVVLSPGISINAPFARRAEELGIEVIGEIELAYRFLQADLVAITGTNGKTTTTALTGEIFKAAGHKTRVLGNIGVPIAAEALQTRPGEVVVAEVAGFQLESTKEFHPGICAVLNITEDHLDRFGNMAAYIASKEHIFKNQTKADHAVLNYDDPVVRGMAIKTKAQVFYFSRRHRVDRGAYVDGDAVMADLGAGPIEVCKTKEIRIPGAHNLENAMAATLCAMCYGIEASVVREALMAFPGVEHRIEFVREVDGVRFINDSKGTNPDASIKAIEAMERPTVLLAGGYDKKSDFAPMILSFGGRIKAVVALGDTAKQVMDACAQAGYDAVWHANSFEEAVHTAFSLAEPGDNVLLSPACASYDMFKDFEHRGREFKRIVYKLER
ncbi:MAG: UDP-N-acetylmuramoyl-L-alanine--D-glutamate ligase [Bacillota bacterium]